MENPGRMFFCDNCSTFCPSKEHWVRITKNGSIIIHDVCDNCGVTQEIESTDNRKRIDTHRIKNKEEGKSENN
jgi:RNase P subunit RPR2